MDFADSILWPLFHYHPGEITFDESAWIAYKDANRLFAKAIAKNVKDGDMVWVHDYHLMLLPQMLREEIGDTKKNIKIGFFLHTPFQVVRFIESCPCEMTSCSAYCIPTSSASTHTTMFGTF